MSNSPGDWLGHRNQADLSSPINDSSLCSLSKYKILVQGAVNGPVSELSNHKGSTVDLPCDLPCAASLAGIQPVRPRAQRTSP